MSAKTYKILFLIIGVATLGYMVYVMGLDIMWENIKKTGFWFFPIIGSWLIVYIMNAFAFKDIIQEPDLPRSNLPFLRVLQLTITGYAINYITPFVALGGEPYRIMELKPRLGTSKASSSVLLYSLMHMFSHVLFWLASIVLILVFLSLNMFLFVGCCLLLVTGVLLCWWFLRVYKQGFMISLFSLLGRLPFVGEKIALFKARKEDVLLEIDDQVKKLYSLRRPRFYSSLGWEFGARVMGCAEIYFTAKAIGLEMTVVESLIVSSGSSLFANLIFFFPMQLGTREGGLALALKSIGMPAGAGIFIGIVTRIREFVWILIGLILMGFSKKQTAKYLDLSMKTQRL